MNQTHQYALTLYKFHETTRLRRRYLVKNSAG